jgi:hypothetical protein
VQLVDHSESLAAAVAVGDNAAMIKQLRKERDAVKALVKLGGQVSYNNPANPSEPSWFLEWAGACNVSRIDFSGRIKVTDAGLMHLRELTQLQYLHLTRTEITDAGLVHLKGLTNLQTLGLEGTKVTEVGVNDLQKALPDCKISR